MTDKVKDMLTEVAVERLATHPKNVRVGDVDAIAQSLERFGQVKPLIVQRSTGYVVAGNHTLLAIRKLGWPTARILVKDLEDEEALAYLVADNRTSDRASYDEGGLLDLLGEVDLEGTGFDVDDLETLADRIGGNVAVGDTGDVVKVQATPPNPNSHNARKEPMKDIVMLMTATEAREFGADIARLQTEWGLRTVVETVRQAVHTCVEQADDPR